MFSVRCVNNCNRAVHKICRLTYCQQQRCCSSNSKDLKQKREVDDHYDVIVSGGGMAGFAMASALGHNQLFKDKRILLLEASKARQFEGLPERYSSRTVALSPATQAFLQSFGAWDEITGMRCQPVKRMQVWDAYSNAMIAFQANDMQENLATIVENDVVQAALTHQAQAADNVNIQYSAKVNKYHLPQVSQSPSGHVHGSDLAFVQLDDGRLFSTNLLIGADGFRSLLRQAAKINTVQWDYDQMGVVAVLELSEPTENNVAWQKFLKTGPLALLPLSDKHSCLIWTTSTEKAKNLLKLEDGSFVDAVNSALWSEESKDPIAEYAGNLFDNIITTIGLEGSSSKQLPPTFVGVESSNRAAFPLGLLHAEQYVKRRVALIGDAAHRCHPLAGQGINLGFADASCLCDQLNSAIGAGADIGALPHLVEYESQRQRGVLPVLGVTNSLVRLYGTDWSPIVLLRSLGLQAVNAMTPIKDRIIEMARTAR